MAIILSIFKCETNLLQISSVVLLSFVFAWFEYEDVRHSAFHEVNTSSKSAVKDTITTP